MALVNNPVLGINLQKNQNDKSPGYGKYYPVIDLQPTLSTRGFAQHMIDHGSKYQLEDVYAMLRMFASCLPELVAQGIPVKFDGLGIFRPTCEVREKKAVLNVAAMEGLNPREVVKAIHIRFIPDTSTLDDLSGPAFADACQLELRNIIVCEKLTVNGKEKTVQRLTPISTALADLKAGSTDSGSGGSSSGGSDLPPSGTTGD